MFSGGFKCQILQPKKKIEEASDSVENMIYEINNTQVMLDSEMSATKWHRKRY